MTFQLLRRRDHVARCFLVLGVHGNDAEQQEHHWALVFEEWDTSDGRRWWMAMVEYRTDPQSGLGLPIGDWVDSGETNNPAALPPFLLQLASPPPGSRAADVRDAPHLWMPDMKFAFGDLAAHVDPPKDAKQMVELAASLAAKELLDGTIQGSVVVRIVGRSWEQWVLAGDLPAEVGEMVRWIANHRLPAAEGVALAHIAVKSSDVPPAPGLQIIGEFGEEVVETWTSIHFPEGPSGPKLIPEVRWWPARPTHRDQRWLGVASKADFEHGGPVG